MSYDYFVCRLKRAVTSLVDLDETAMSFEDWFQSGCDILQSEFPELGWEHEEEDFCGYGNHLEMGRFAAMLTRSSGATWLRVEGRGGAEQDAYVCKLAGALGAIAFESQGGRLISHSSTVSAYESQQAVQADSPAFGGPAA